MSIAVPEPDQISRNLAQLTGSEGGRIGMEVGLLLRDYADGKIDRSEAEKRLQATVDSGGIVLNRIDALKRGIPADTAQAPAAVLDDTKAGVRRIGVDNIV